MAAASDQRPEHGAVRLPLDSLGQRAPAQAIVGLSVLLGVVIGVVDWITGPDLSLVVFYLLPVLVVAWLCTDRVAYAFAGVVALEGLAIGLLAPAADGPSDAVLAWNAGVRLVFYVLVVWLVSAQKRLLERLQRHAVTDPLTGVLNRRALAEAAERELARARRHQEPISVVYLDLDDLKEANDTVGHEAGDAMIVHVARTARRVLRAEDLFARLGGDEFAAVLPDADAVEAGRIVERLVEGFADHDGPPVRASVGVWTEVAPTGGIEELLQAADRLMYDAKQAGGGAVRTGGTGGAT